MKILQFNESLIYIYIWEARQMADIQYDIVEEIGVLSENAKGWKRVEQDFVEWSCIKV